MWGVGSWDVKIIAVGSSSLVWFFRSLNSHTRIMTNRNSILLNTDQLVRYCHSHEARCPHYGYPLESLCEWHPYLERRNNESRERIGSPLVDCIRLESTLRWIQKVGRLQPWTGSNTLCQAVGQRARLLLWCLSRDDNDGRRLGSRLWSHQW